MPETVVKPPALSYPDRAIDWPAIRKAFIESAERPTYPELAERFNLPTTRVSKVSSEEGWAVLRASFLENKLKECDASMAILTAAKVDQTMVRKASVLAMKAFEVIHEIFDDAELAKRAATTRIQVYQSCSFALVNVCNAMKTIGAVGLPAALKNAGAGRENGQWDPTMVQQINVNLTGLAAKVSAESKPVERVADADV